MEEGWEGGDLGDGECEGECQLVGWVKTGEDLRNFGGSWWIWMELRGCMGFVTVCIM